MFLCKTTHSRPVVVRVALRIKNWFVLLGGARPPAPSVRQVVCVSSPTFSPVRAAALLSPRVHTHSSSLVSVSQGSTESCNNAEEEELKGRKGTAPAFSSFSVLPIKLRLLAHCSKTIGLHEMIS